MEAISNQYSHLMFGLFPGDTIKLNKIPSLKPATLFYVSSASFSQIINRPIMHISQKDVVKCHRWKGGGEGALPVVPGLTDQIDYLILFISNKEQ